MCMKINQVKTYSELSNLPVVYQMVLSLWGDGVSQPLSGRKMLQKEKSSYVAAPPPAEHSTEENLSFSQTYIAELSRQYAEFVDGIQRHHGHGRHGQTPPHCVSPGRKHVGAIFWRVELGKAHHHHVLWKNNNTKIQTNKNKLPLFGLHECLQCCIIARGGPHAQREDALYVTFCQKTNCMWQIPEVQRSNQWVRAQW